MAGASTCWGAEPVVMNTERMVPHMATAMPGARSRSAGSRVLISAYREPRHYPAAISRVALTGNFSTLHNASGLPPVDERDRFPKSKRRRDYTDLLGNFRNRQTTFDPGITKILEKWA